MEKFMKAKSEQAFFKVARSCFASSWTHRPAGHNQRDL